MTLTKETQVGIEQRGMEGIYHQAGESMLSSEISDCSTVRKKTVKPTPLRRRANSSVDTSCSPHAIERQRGHRSGVAAEGAAVLQFGVLTLQVLEHGRVQRSEWTARKDMIVVGMR